LARSRVGGKPVAITQPGIMTWGARENISRVGSSTKTRRHSR
jgi:hypothetical protein